MKEYKQALKTGLAVAIGGCVFGGVYKSCQNQKKANEYMAAAKQMEEVYQNKVDSINAHFDEQIDMQYGKLDVLSAEFTTKSKAANKAESEKCMNRIDSLQTERDNALKNVAAISWNQALQLHAKADSIMGR